MGSVNKVILLGRLGKDPEYKPDVGNGLCTFSLATSERYKDRDGNNQERTEWHRVTCWGRTAELARDYLQKGSQLYLEGQNATREWTDRDGNKRYTTEVKAHILQFIGGREQGGGQRGGGGGGYSGGRGQSSQRGGGGQRSGGRQHGHDDGTSDAGGWGGGGQRGGGGWGDLPKGLPAPDTQDIDDDDLPF